MRNRAWLLIGPALAALLVLVALLFPWRASNTASAPRRGAPSAASVPPVIGSDGIGDPYFPRAGNGGFDITAYDIQVRYDPPARRLEGHTMITARALERLSGFNLDLRLTASAVTVNDQLAQIHQADGELQVTPVAPVPVGAPMIVRVDYGGKPSDILDGVSGSSPWTTTVDGALAVNEPDIAPWWYPSNNHPSDKASYTITAIVPTGLTVIANGALLGGPEPAGPGLVQWRWQESDPMAPYLAFIAIGNYDIVRRDTRFGLYLAAFDRGLAPPLEQAARESVEQTPEILEFLAGIFGPYPFHQLGGVVPDAPTLSFALETQTRPVYGQGFFDTGPNNSVVVHELAHQWFGDSVSMRHWSDIWLNEGFATYAQWLWDENHGGPSCKQRADREYASHPDGPFWGIPPGNPGPRTVLSNAVYTRGAMALQALRTAVGDENLAAAFRSWTTERAGGNGSVQDFLAVVERVSGKKVDGIAQTWLFAPTRPPAPPS
jgi:aminopeptidase N